MGNPILKLYVLVFSILGILAFVYRTLLGKFFIKKFEYIVQSIKKLGDKTIEISLKPKNKKLNFIPGQFIFISFFQKELSKEEHPFSISSSKYEDEIKITTKVLGDYTQNIFNILKPGALAKIEGPFGSFSYENYSNKNQIWIAGGVGITPFISFIKSINPELGYTIKLFYCVKKKDEAIYLNLLKEYEQNFNNRLQIISFYSEEKGHISTKDIYQTTPNLDEYDFYICAPIRMITELKKGLISSNIKNKHIHSEEFNF